MKVDKSNPRHWVYLGLFGLNTVIAILLRPWIRFRRRTPRTRQIILYGHRLSGNLLALHRYINKFHSDEFCLTFLTMDPNYHQRLRDEGIRACLATRPAAIHLMSTTDAVISDHGLHSMVPLLWLTDIKFFDVWHGIPFKGFDRRDFRVQHRYTEVWVASPLLANLYEEKFGFQPNKVCVTGYARTDKLVEPVESNEEIRARLGLQHTTDKKLVLFAPTWSQDDAQRPLFPFKTRPEQFLEDIASLCLEHNAVPVLRAHINAELPTDTRNNHFTLLPFGQYPDTEALLQITDMLICDWSSIAFDFLLLNRPTIFLDVSPPFAKGFSLGKEYRFDRIVNNYHDLLKVLRDSIGQRSDEDSFGYQNRQSMAKQIYGQYADGKASERCVLRLRRHFPDDRAA